MNLGLDKLLSFTQSFWLKLGREIATVVRQDFQSGIMQNDTQGHRYKSEQYKRYKANQMRTYSKVNKGKRLKAYYGLPIVSTQTGFVDMTLTGRLSKGLRPISATNNSVLMGYMPEDTGKILGNQKHGYDVVGLNTKNINFVKDKIIEELTVLERQIPNNITINISI